MTEPPPLNCEEELSLPPTLPKRKRVALTMRRVGEVYVLAAFLFNGVFLDTWLGEGDLLTVFFEKKTAGVSVLAALAIGAVLSSRFMLAAFLLAAIYPFLFFWDDGSFLLSSIGSVVFLMGVLGILAILALPGAIRDAYRAKNDPVILAVLAAVLLMVAHAVAALGWIVYAYLVGYE